MLLHIPQVFTKDEVAVLRGKLDAGPWADGNMTSGHQSATAKRNQQLPEDSAVAREVSALVAQALHANPMFVAAALPHTLFPPLFNRYEGGGEFGTHVDNAIRQQRGGGALRIRSDLSATLFLSEPEDYDGGELVVEEMYGSQSVKLPAGDLVLYPSKSLHHVTPVTRGARVSSFMWLQSLVRDDGDREMLFRLDVATQRVAVEKGPKDQAVIELTGVYHNLLRRWAEV
ncbi:MAG: Fe2+-dependent dioxygenase [Brevundimonas sp.]|uniref:Fe2+-dependent dioxygenase n=1 Tax=Brevundimonas albigilva TaxID=1312364 RepID=A0ABY4SGV7_9CAUL|nr:MULTISPECIES: Fe2+-dependent dioxygenase [Brevundimonas]PZU60322.1 MAG: Fe2+-dependent dioxygenase [Brevundimonas sp.]UQV17847.1 Fe2+-dependent dioxygenase [Brevundimonas albigilva]URI14240.1 Fe2+-dependent dioxygenase [Brevundimonas albigilva]